MVNDYKCYKQRFNSKDAILPIHIILNVLIARENSIQLNFQWKCTTNLALLNLNINMDSCHTLNFLSTLKLIS